MNQKYDVPAAVIGNVVRELLESDAKKVTAYLTPKLTVKASRLTFDGKVDQRSARADVRLTLGVPNHSERAFIKSCVAAGEPFPVKKMQIRMPPVR